MSDLRAEGLVEPEEVQRRRSNIGPGDKSPLDTEVRELGWFRALLRALWRDKYAFGAMITFVIIVLVAIAAPLIAPKDPVAQSIVDRLSPPVWASGSWEYPLGTDGLGRDVLSRLMYGARISLLAGALTMVFSGALGITLGILGGYRRGWIDSWVRRGLDLQVALPSMLVVLVFGIAFSRSLTSVVVILVVTNWGFFARVIRGMVLSMTETSFIENAEIVGCKPARVTFRHILPNLTTTVATLAVLQFGWAVLEEASISFLGLGVQPPATSWGLDIALGRDYIFEAWWLVTLPGLAIALTVLSLNVLAGWLRVAIDPATRETQFASVEEFTPT